MAANHVSKESIERQKVDKDRALRVVKYIDYPFLLPDSPIELEEGYIVSDRQTCEVFASFIFKNISERPIQKLNIRLECYQNQNIPYLHIDFTYSQADLTFGIISKNGVDMKLRDANQKRFIEKSETFGSCVFIPIPESYFKKMEVVLVSVEYINGDLEMINTVVAGDTKRYRELDDISKRVYTRVNIYQAAEERFPTVVIPQFGSKGWLCCCGNKNPDSCSECEKCGREKEWQKNNVSHVALQETKRRIVSDPREIAFHDKSKFKQNKFLENDSDVQKKIEQYEKAMRNVALEEQRREKRRMMLIPKIIAVILVFVLIVFAIRLFDTLKGQSSVEGGGVVDTVADVSVETNVGTSSINPDTEQEASVPPQ